MNDDLNPGDLDGFTVVPTLEDDYDIIVLPEDTIVFDQWVEREGFDPDTGKYDHVAGNEPTHAHGPRRPGQDSADPNSIMARPRREFLPDNVLFDSHEYLAALDINSNWCPTGKDEGLFPLCHECGNQLVEDESLARCCVCTFQVTRRKLLAGSALDDAE